MRREKLIILSICSLLIINFLIFPASSTSFYNSSNNTNEWEIFRWYEIYNISNSEEIYGWTIIQINLLEKNATGDIYLEFEIPAINNSIVYYYPNISDVQFKREQSDKDVYIIFTADNSIFKNYSTFEFAISYKIRPESFLQKKSEWYESIIKYRFETNLYIIDEILPKGKKWNSPIINIYLLLPDYVNLATPENFSIVPKDKIPSLNNVHANNRTAIEQKIYSNIVEKPVDLPSLEPNEKNYLLIRYIEGSSPGYIYFEYSFTNKEIVFYTFFAVVLGIFSFIIAISKIPIKIYKSWKKRKEKPIQEKSNEEKII